MEIQCRYCSLRCTPFCYVDPQECFNLSYYVDAQDFNLSYYVDPQECFNLSYEDEILLNDDLSESSLAYAIPRDSQNREAQGAESPAKSLDYTKEV